MVWDTLCMMLAGTNIFQCLLILGNITWASVHCRNSSFLNDICFTWFTVSSQECNAGIMGVDGHVGRPGVDICTFARGLTLSYHNVVWQGDQCLIFHTVLPYWTWCRLLVWLNIPVADTPGIARYSSQSHNPDIVLITPRSILINLSAKQGRG